MPGYKAGETAVQRSMMAQGYGGSGNMMAALQEYGGNAFNQEAARLSSLAGSQFPPTGGNTLMAGNIAANDLASKSLASMGYALSGGSPMEQMYRMMMGGASSGGGITDLISGLFS
jgi:hypothetical protein